MNIIAHAATIIVLFAGPAAVFALVPRCNDFYEAMLFGALAGALAGVTLAGAAMLLRARLTLRWNAACSWAAAFIAIAFVSALFAKNTALALRACGHLTIFFACFYILFNIYAETGASERALWLIAAVAALYAAHGIGQFTGFFPFGMFSGMNGYDPLRPPRHDFLAGYSVNSVFGNRNLLGDCIALALPVACGLWLRARGMAGRIAAMAMIVLIVFCLGLTGSRGSILGAGCGVAALTAGLMLSRNRNRIALAAVIFIVAAAVAVGITRIGAEHFKQDSVRLRRITQGATLEMIRDNPVTGVGLDRFRHEHLMYQAKYFEKPERRKYAYLVNMEKQRHAHNEYLQVAAETGLPGFTAFMGLLIVYGAALIRAVRSAAQGDSLPAALFGAFVCFCILIAFGFPARIPITMSLLTVLAAAAIAFLHTSGAMPVHERANIFTNFLKSHRMRWEAVIALFVVCLGAGLNLALDPYRSAEYFRRGFSNMRSNNMIAANIACLSAFHRDRDNGNASYCLGVASLRLRHSDDAVPRLEAAMRGIDDPELRLQLARAYRAENRPDDAEKQLSIVKAMTPEYVKPRMELASLYASQGKKRNEEKEYREVIRILINEHARQGNNTERSRLIAELYYRTGDMKNYEKWIQRAGI